MKHIRILIVLYITVMLAFTFCACGVISEGSDKSSTKTKENTSAESVSPADETSLQLEIFAMTGSLSPSTTAFPEMTFPPDTTKYTPATSTVPDTTEPVPVTETKAPETTKQAPVTTTVRETTTTVVPETTVTVRETTASIETTVYVPTAEETTNDPNLMPEGKIF